MDALHQHYRERMNQLGRQRIPFLCIIDFDRQQPILLPLDEINQEEVLYDINGRSNTPLVADSPAGSFYFDKKPVSLEEYQQAFEVVKYHLQAGNSFLVNLTFPTPVNTNLSLKDIFFHSQARYKLWLRDRFVVFSPEIFIRIEQGVISSYPMKGTINAQVPDAQNKLLNNPKELAEHVTIVDLIRNDMSTIASQVAVKRFRYVDHLSVHDKELLQVSSHITGLLPANYHEHLGDIIWAMLPAGSVSGAPKAKTLAIIQEAETYHRGYYTGIVGLFDGENWDSGVMIRFIENIDGKLYFKSGGGITAQSDLRSEYEEFIEKIYVPIHRNYQDRQRNSLQPDLP